MHPLRRTIGIEPDVTLISRDVRIHVTGSDRRLVATVESAGLRATAAALLDRGLLAPLRLAADIMTRFGIDLDVRLGNRTIARAGASARPGLLSRMLGSGRVELRPAAVAASVPGMLARTSRRRRP